MSLTQPAAHAAAALRRTCTGELVEELDQQVREIVRREGVDPEAERIIAEAESS
jgi:pilus assembly protein CpaF